MLDGANRLLGVLHEAHHRAQALNMLRRLGVTIEGEIDFNATMYERRFVDA